jgi:hypothetical protein
MRHRGHHAQRLDELHVDLPLVARPLLLVALPPGLLAFIALRCRQPAQPELVQDPPNPRRADCDVMIALLSTSVEY